MLSGEGKGSDIRGTLDWVDFKAPSSREPELSMWQRQPSTAASTAVKALLMWGVDRIYFLHCRSWGPLCVPGLGRFSFQQPAHGPFWRTACGLWNRLSCTCREPECQDFPTFQCRGPQPWTNTCTHSPAQESPACPPQASKYNIYSRVPSGSGFQGSWLRSYFCLTASPVLS